MSIIISYKVFKYYGLPHLTWNDHKLIKKWIFQKLDLNLFLKILKNFEKYKEKFIAVKNSSLLAVGDGFEEVMDELEDEQIDPNSVIVEYIPSEEEIWAL